MALVELKTGVLINPDHVESVEENPSGYADGKKEVIVTVVSGRKWTLKLPLLQVIKMLTRKE